MRSKWVKSRFWSKNFLTSEWYGTKQFKNKISDANFYMSLESFGLNLENKLWAVGTCGTVVASKLPQRSIIRSEM